MDQQRSRSSHGRDLDGATCCNAGRTENKPRRRATRQCRDLGNVRMIRFKNSSVYNIFSKYLFLAAPSPLVSTVARRARLLHSVRWPLDVSRSCTPVLLSDLNSVEYIATYSWDHDCAHRRSRTRAVLGLTTGVEGNWSSSKRRPVAFQLY